MFQVTGTYAIFNKVPFLPLGESVLNDSLNRFKKGISHDFKTEKNFRQQSASISC